MKNNNSSTHWECTLGSLQKTDNDVLFLKMNKVIPNLSRLRDICSIMENDLSNCHSVMVVDLTNCLPFTRDNRLLVDKMLKTISSRLAMYSESDLGFMIGRLYIKLSDKDYPKSLFRTKEDAMHWACQSEYVGT